MFLVEMFNDKVSEYQDVTSDNSRAKVSDLRKTRLTLAQINQLRKMNDQRNLEYKEELQRVKKQYGAPPPQPAM